MITDSNDFANAFINTTPLGASTVTFASGGGSTGLDPVAVATADINGDGRPDLLTASQLDDTVSVLINDTAPGASIGQFLDKQDFATGSDPNSVSAADVNGDGRLDLLVTNDRDDAVSVLVNITAPGVRFPLVFADPQSFATGHTPTPAARSTIQASAMAAACPSAPS